MPKAATKADPRRRAMLAKIHMAKKELALHDDSYRALLERVTGKQSAADCTPAQLAAVLEEFKSLGWVPKRGKRARRPQLSPQAYKAKALWRSLYLLGEISEASDALLAGFVRRQTGRDALQWCSPQEINTVIEALKDRCERAGFDQPDDERIASINRWRKGAELEPAAAGFAAKVGLIECLWSKLTESGALEHGQAASIGVWLVKRFGVMAPWFLSEQDAQRAVDQLGVWWRRAKAEQEA